MKAYSHFQNFPRHITHINTFNLKKEGEGRGREVKGGEEGEGKRGRKRRGKLVISKRNQNDSLLSELKDSITSYNK